MSKKLETIVIREVYSEGTSSETFEYDLECALDAGVHYIVIEPTKLGEETSRWIKVGNCLHKTSVLAGLCSLVVPHLCSDHLRADLTIGVPAGVLSIGCAALYGISWQFDPCCKYQVTVNSRELSKLNVHNLTNSSPVVLVRKDDFYRKWLHNSIGVLCGIFIFKSLEQVWNS